MTDEELHFELSPLDLPAARVRDEIVRLIKAGLPLGLSILTGSLMVSTDVLFMGWLGPSQMAAGSLAFVFYAVVTQFCIGLLYAVGTAIAHHLGSERFEGVAEVLRGATKLLAVIFFLSLPLLHYSDVLLVHLGQDAWIAHEASLFLSLMCFALPSTLCFLLMSQFMIAHDQGGAILWVSVVGVAVNGVLDAVLIFPNRWLPGWGIRGAALSSVITEFLMAFVLLLLSRRTLSRYLRAARAPNPLTTRELWRVGAPLAVLEVVLFSFFAQMTVLVGGMGTSALNAHGMFMQATDLVMYVMFGFGEAAAIRIAFLVGAGDTRTQRVAVSAHIRFALLYGAVMGTLVYSSRALIVWIYTTDNAAYVDARALASSIAIGAGLLIAANPVQFMLVSLLRGFADTKFSLVCSILCFGVLGTGLGCLLAFSCHLGPLGIWLGILVGVIVLAACLWRRLYTHHLAFAQ